MLIDFRELYFSGPAHVPKELEDVLREFPNTRFRAVDINYGWAAAEASWRRGLGPNVAVRRRLVHAAAHIVEWDINQITKVFASRRPPVDRDKRWPRVPVDDPRQTADPRIFVGPQYGAILFLLHLHSRRGKEKQGGSLKALTDFRRWTSDVMGIRSSYVLALAINLLIGDGTAKDEANRILKLTGTDSPDEMARKAWNVAWDISMVALTEGGTYGLLPGSPPASSALLTRDLDPILFRLGTETKMILDDGREKMPFSRMTPRPNIKVDKEELAQLLEVDPLEDLIRARRNPEQVAAQCFEAISELESSLGLSVRALRNKG